MIEIGRMNRLKAVKMVDFGMYLDGGEGVEIRLVEKWGTNWMSLFIKTIRDD